MYWGQPPAIGMAKQALKNFLHSLPIGSKFNIVGFGCHSSPMFNESVDYTEENLNLAIKEVDTFDSKAKCLGGTNIIEPLEFVFSKQPTNEMKRQIYLLTDGAVYDTRQIIDLINRNVGNNNTRIHTFGVGSGADQDLVRGVANAGFGSYFFIYNFE